MRDRLASFCGHHTNNIASSFSCIFQLHHHHRKGSRRDLLQPLGETSSEGSNSNDNFGCHWLSTSYLLARILLSATVATRDNLEKSSSIGGACGHINDKVG